MRTLNEKLNDGRRRAARLSIVGACLAALVLAACADSTSKKDDDDDDGGRGGGAPTGGGGGGGAGGAGGATGTGGAGGGGGAGGNLPKYTITEDTVTDNTAGLTWQRGFGGQMTYADITAYCASLTIAGGGFRAPTIEELTSLVVTGQSPSIDQEAFPGTPEAWFWSATLHEQSSAFAWSVAFYDGHSNAVSVGDVQYIRCVR